MVLVDTIAGSRITIAAVGEWLFDAVHTYTFMYPGALEQFIEQ